MIRKIISLFLATGLSIGCSKNSITGRNQAKLIRESELQKMAVPQYQQFLSTSKVISESNNKDVEMVTRVGQNITRAVQNYYAQKGLSRELEGYQWEYKLVDSKEANAWCMPGGKIVVYTGLLPITQNEAALAAVMGHEVTHAIFYHGNERMSQGLIQQVGGVALQVAMANKPGVTQDLFMNAYGAGSQAGVLLPFSRKHELEADRYGLIWTAMAGYDPQEAINFWERMASEDSSGQKKSQLLSSHPSDSKRIEQLKKYMPEALSYYKPAGN